MRDNILRQTLYESKFVHFLLATYVLVLTSEISISFKLNSYSTLPPPGKRGMSMVRGTRPKYVACTTHTNCCIKSKTHQIYFLNILCW